MKALKDKRILILLIPFFAVLLLYLLRQPDPHFGDSEDFQAWAREDIQGWLEKDYVSLDDWESFVAALRSMEIQGAEHLLSDAQKTAYWESLADFLHAGASGGNARGLEPLSLQWRPTSHSKHQCRLSCEILSSPAGFS